MGLQAVVDSLDGVPEPLRDFYTETEGGKFALEVEGAGGGSGNGVDPEVVDKLKASLSKANQEAAQRRHALQRWEELGLSPEDVAALKEAREADERKKAEEAGEFEKLREQMQDKHQKQLAALEDEKANLASQLDRVLVDDQILRAAGKHEAFAHLLPEYARKFVRTEVVNGERRVVVVDENGDRRLDDEGRDMTVDQLVSWMRSQETYGPLFKGKGVAGGGASGGKGAGGAPRKKFSEMSEAEKMDLADELEPEEYARLVAESVSS